MSDHHPHPYYPRGTFQNHKVIYAEYLATGFVVGVVVGCIVMFLINRFL